MGVYEGRGQLDKAMKELLGRWLETTTHWGDARSRQFEERFLRSFEMDVKQAAGAMEHMVIILSRAHSDCDDNG